MKKSEGNLKILLKNKKAFHNYEITDRFEAGIVLLGTEIKSLREGKINIAESYCRIEKDDQLSLLGMNIATYEQGGYTNHEPLRKRRLLMHKREIQRIRAKLQERGFSLVPISVYFKRNLVKFELGLGKGKSTADKRQSLKKKEAQREIKQYRSREKYN